MTRQTSTRSTSTAPANVGSEALAEQAAITNAGVADDNVPESTVRAAKAKKDDKPERYDRARARADANDTARKQYAKRNKAKLFPEEKPEDGEIVLAWNPKRVGSTTFEAQYRAQSNTGNDGAFYSNRDGTFSMLEGAVACWMDMPS